MVMCSFGRANVGSSRAGGYASQPSCKEVVITVGIDVAAQPERTAGCWIRWDNNVGTVEQVEQPLADDRLRSILVEDPVDKIGVDVPLGWPAAFVSAIGAHHAGKPWPAGTTSDLTRRVTDWHVR